MAKKNQEIPGNTLGSQALLDRTMLKLGVAIQMLQYRIETLEEEGIVVKAIRLSYRGGPQGEVLAVITASTEGAEIVAFQSGADMQTVLGGLSNRLRNGSLKWKEDEYAK